MNLLPSLHHGQDITSRKTTNITTTILVCPWLLIQVWLRQELCLLILACTIWLTLGLADRLTKVLSLADYTLDQSRRHLPDSWTFTGFFRVEVKVGRKRRGVVRRIRTVNMNQ